MLALLLSGACSRELIAPDINQLSTACVGDGNTGEATWYRTDGRGNCSFGRRGDPLVAAMNTADYDEAALCGACVYIQGPTSGITVRVVDRCPGCKQGDIDLNREAFERLAPASVGRIPIRWQRVPCPVQGSLEYHFKAGGNQWWTAVQVRNHRHPIARLEYVDKTGKLRALRRARYNYFIEQAGMGPGPYTFVVTDVLGNQVRDEGVPLRIGQTVKSHAQLRECR